jgi:hypothetical protein
MGTVALPRRIARSYAVTFGLYGDVTRQAQERGACRQTLSREAAQVVALLEGAAPHADVERLGAQNRQLRARVAALTRDLDRSVVAEEDRVARSAAASAAEGVSLAVAQRWLSQLRPGRAPRVATLGRWVQHVAVQVGALLPALDAFARAEVRQASAGEIYVPAPVRMVVEPESLCWLTGSVTAQASGASWAGPFGTLPALEQVTRDAGCGLRKGVALLDAQRRAQGRAPVADQLGHFHTPREGGRGRRKGERRPQQASTKPSGRGNGSTSGANSDNPCPAGPPRCARRGPGPSG